MAERTTALYGVADSARAPFAPKRIIAQVLCYALFGLLVGYFADSPAYRHLAPNSAVVKLSFNHAGAHVTACRRRTPTELAALAPNMRQLTQCPRARVPLRVELDLDGRRLYAAELPPGGLAKDGESSVYQRFTLPAGKHRLVMRLRDSRRKSGFDYVRKVAVDLTPGELFVIDFNPQAGGFQFPAGKPLAAVGRGSLQPVDPVGKNVAAYHNAARVAPRHGSRGAHGHGSRWS